MSTAILSNNNSSFLSGHTNRGISDTAKNLKTQLSNLRDELFPSEIFDRTYNQAFISLEEALNEAATDNWDGCGAKAYSASSLDVALRLIDSLPTTIPAPEAGVDPDGEISIDWYLDSDRALSISISGNGQLSYAAMFKDGKTHGTEYFGDELPKEILEKLRRLFS